MSDARDPLAPSSDPDIPTPTREDLIRLVHRQHQENIRQGTADSHLVQTLLEGARKAWDDRHKRKAERRREEEAKQSEVKEIGLPLVGGALEEKSPDGDSDLPGTFRDIEPQAAARLNEIAQDATRLGDAVLGTGTRVPGQISHSATEHDRQQREQEEIESEVVATMRPSHRKQYADPCTSEDQRKAIFDTYKEKLDQKKAREEVEFKKRLNRIADAHEWLQRIKGDPTKAHLPLPADDSDEALLEWHDKMSQTTHAVPHPRSADPPQEVSPDPKGDVAHTRGSEPGDPIPTPSDFQKALDEANLGAAKVVADEAKRVLDQIAIQRTAETRFRKIAESQRRMDRIRDPTERPRSLQRPRSDDKKATPIIAQPGSLLDTLSKVGEGLSRIGDGVVRAITEAPGTAQTSVQVESDHVRSPAMARFFNDAERFRGHFAWIGKAVSSWVAVLAIFAILWGGGTVAMQMNQVPISIGFFLVAFFVIAVKAIAETKDRERSFLIAAMVVMVFILHLLWVIYTHNQFGQTQ